MHIEGLPYFVALSRYAARYGRERTLILGESAIRARFVRDSFHSLSIRLTAPLHRLFPVALWYKMKWNTGIAPMTSTAGDMNKQILKGVMERVETWPAADQAELLEYALEIEARHAGRFEPTPEELEGIDRGLQDARAGRFATDKEVEAVFAKYRGR